MKRRFNYTGRSKINRSQVSIALRNEDGVAAFDASVDLSELDAPPTASVFVEAYYKRTYMRFPFGTVAEIQPPYDRRLTDLDSGSQVYFRIKVVEPGEQHGRLLAVADGIRAALDETESKADQFCILPVNFKEDMGELPYRLSIDAGDGPMLEVNAQIPGAREYVARDPIFLALVYPPVVRAVVEEVFRLETDMDSEGDQTWPHLWLRFAVALVNTQPPAAEDEEEVSAWLDDVMDAVASRLRLMSNLTDALRGTDDRSIAE